jgi:hypothetical protein
MSAHTPGPWGMRATSHGDGRYTLRVGPLSGALGAQDTPPMFEATLEHRQTLAGVRRAEISGNTGALDLETELRARARLMMAAPDLLDAVRLVLALHDARDEVGPGGAVPGFRVHLDPKAEQQLRSAIVQATGGES